MRSRIRRFRTRASKTQRLVQAGSDITTYCCNRRGRRPGRRSARFRWGRGRRPSRRSRRRRRARPGRLRRAPAARRGRARRGSRPDRTALPLSGRARSRDCCRYLGMSARPVGLARPMKVMGAPSRSRTPSMSRSRNRSTRVPRRLRAASPDRAITSSAKPARRRWSTSPVQPSGA